jgi:NTP pyrophosphatase (non-canonical NTP hydrolase)
MTPCPFSLTAAMTQLEELRAVVRQFVAERGWDQHHNPKNLAMAMTVEAAEVLEHFQWLSEAESFRLSPEKRREVAHELSDVLMGVIRVADLLEIDLAAAFAEKMELNRQKYPPEKVRGRAVKYTEL